MVSFDQTDFKIVVSMALFLVIISFMFPPMGFTSANVTASDIPEFNTSANQFDFVQEPPERPTNPSSGMFEYIHGAESQEDKRQFWLNGDSADGTSITFINTQTQSNPQMQFSLIHFNDTGSYSETRLINESEFVTIDEFNYSVSADNVEFGEDNERVTADWQLNDQPEDTGFIERIPIVGGLYSGTVELASMLAWIGQIIFYVVILAFEFITNAAIALFNVILFIFGFFFWTISTYGGIIGGAPSGWIAILVALPGVIISFEFGKIMLILIRTVLDAVPLT